jgi:hypothetical protein
VQNTFENVRKISRVLQNINSKTESENMKLKTIKHFGLGLAAAVGLATSVEASVEYQWVVGGESTYSPVTPTSVGYLYYTPGSGTYGSGGTISSFSFTENPGGTETGFVGTPTVTVLADGNLIVTGVSDTTFLLGFGSSSGSAITYNSSNENAVQDNGTLGGDWVAVPEASTMIFGGLLLLPFGLITSQSLRKIRSVA